MESPEVLRDILMDLPCVGYRGLPFEEGTSDGAEPEGGGQANVRIQGLCGLDVY